METLKFVFDRGIYTIGNCDVAFEFYVRRIIVGYSKSLKLPRIKVGCEKYFFQIENSTKIISEFFQPVSYNWAIPLEVDNISDEQRRMCIRCRGI